MNTNQQKTTGLRSRSNSLSSGSEMITMTQEEFRQINLEFWLKIDSLEEEVARERKEKMECKRVTDDLKDELKKIKKALSDSQEKRNSLVRRNDELRSTRSKLEIEVNKYKNEIRGLNRGIMKRDLAKASRRSDGSRRKSQSSKSNDSQKHSGEISSNRKVFIRSEESAETIQKVELKRVFERPRESDDTRAVFISNRPAAGRTVTAGTSGVTRNDSFNSTHLSTAGPSTTGIFINPMPVPPVQEPFRCPLCHDRFRSLASLQFHHRFDHAKNFPFTCVICPYSSSDYMTVKNHIKHHEMDKQSPTSTRCKIGDCKVFSRNAVELAQHQALYH